MALVKRAAADLEKRGATVVPISDPDRTLLGDSSVITDESRRDVDDFLRRQGPGVPVRSFAALYASGSYSTYAKESYDREIKVDPATLPTDPAYRKALAHRAALRSWPADVEFLGRPFAEASIIGVASAYEAATHRRHAPPLPSIG
ncbi:hypothetical protein [Streptomyces sp. NPDC046985]|uniref:hypothetical protein n=1 Tax=Streptomyces sp. NPDC046985 TaxID=3155377 RepID=UPI003401420B